MSARVIITGAGGQLGRALLRAQWPAAMTVTGKTRAELDIGCEPEVDALLAGANVDVIVNAAAYTAVDQAEQAVREAYTVNHNGPHNLAAGCARVGAALVHVSTDYVFDGTKDGAYVETDAIAPKNAYGRSKAAGEETVREELPEHVILRTAWVYSPTGRNFARTILRLAARSDELAIVADQVGNPTSASDLAAAVVQVVDRIVAARAHGGSVPWGTYHCVNAEAATWAGFADAIIGQAAPIMGRRPRVRPITTAQYPTPAVRPANSRLDCGKLAASFGIQMRPWRAALAPVVAELLGRQEQ